MEQSDEKKTETWKMRAAKTELESSVPMVNSPPTAACESSACTPHDAHATPDRPYGVRRSNTPSQN